MSISCVEVIRPILVNGAWIYPGEATIPTDIAKAEDARGNVNIISTDGEPVSWPACCDSH